MSKTTTIKDKDSIYYKDIIFIICVSVVSVVVGIILMAVDIYQDSWYIEGIADGLFGADNRSFLTLGSNFIITGTIYLLSLTGLRLYWFNIILIIMIGGSHIILCKIIMDNIKSKIKYILSCWILIIITPLVSFFLQFTPVASYTIAVGCLLLFETIEKKYNKFWMVFSIIWIILGYSLRLDCVYFSIATMGLVWIFKVIKKCNNSNIGNKKIIFSYLTPFILTLFLMIITQTIQIFLMDFVEGDFYEWNNDRASIDDQGIPEYIQFRQEYREIGINKNDYLLLRSWNNQDQNIFTERVKDQILSINSNMTERKKNGTLFSLILKGLKDLCSHISFCQVLVLMILMGVFIDKKTFLPNILIIFVIILLSIYFISCNKLMWRTRFSMIIVSCVSSIALITGDTYRKNIDTYQKQRILIFASVMFFVSVMFIPFGNTSSLWNVYLSRRHSGDKFYTYLRFDEEKYQSRTINKKATEYIANDKNNLYYRLFEKDFLQQYPLTDYNVFVTAPEGAASNWGSLGQYMYNLSPIQNNLKNYGVQDTFGDLVNDNIRVVTHKDYTEEGFITLNKYLQEHYYDDVDFSVIRSIDNAIIGRYIRNIDSRKISLSESTLEITSKIQPSEYSGLIEIKFKLKNFKRLKDGEAIYLQFTDRSGNSFVYQAIMKKKTGKILVPKTSILQGKEYSVLAIIERKEGRYRTASIKLK